MYVYYEHHRDAYGKIVLTELRATSYSNQWKIAWKNSKENMIFEFVKKALKIPPVASRSYDETTNIWTYLPPYGESILKDIETVTAPVGGVTLHEVTDLAQVVSAGGFFDFSKARKPQKPEDFFYNHGASAQKAPMTKETALSELKKIMELNGILVEGELTKKHYRQAALKLHPDRINDKGAAMADLNVLWGVFNGS